MVSNFHVLKEIKKGFYLLMIHKSSILNMSKKKVEGIFSIGTGRLKVKYIIKKIQKILVTPKLSKNKIKTEEIFNISKY